MERLLYCDLGANSVSEGLSQEGFDWPELTQSEDVILNLRFAEKSGTGRVETFRTVQHVRAGIGRVHAGAEYGKWGVKFGDAPEGEGVNTLAPVDFDITEDDLETAIDNLTGLGAYGDAEVRNEDGSWLIIFADAVAEVPIHITHNSLSPTCRIRVRARELDGVWIHEIRLVQEKAAFSSSFGERQVSAPVIETFQVGSDIDGILTNEIQKITFTPGFRGIYKVKRGNVKTAFLDQDDGPAELQSALNPLADDDSAFVVTRPTSNVGHIEFTGEMGGTSHDLLEVTDVNSPPPDTRVRLSLNDDVAAELLRDADLENDRGTFAFELEIKYEDPEDDTKSITWVYQTEITLRRELIYETEAEVDTRDHVRPVDPTGHIPFDPSQVGNGQQFYPFQIGDGVKVEWLIDHQLHTKNVGVSLKEDAVGGDFLRPGTDYKVKFDPAGTGEDSIVIILLGDYAANPPAAAALFGEVVSREQTSFFDPHIHTMPQVDGLVEAIAALQADIDFLKTMLGTNRKLSISSGTASGLGPSWAFPSLFEAYPSRESIDGSGVGRLVDLDLSQLGRARGLLPAVHDASVESLTAALPSPSSGYLGRVFRNDWQRFQVRSGEGHRFGYSEVGEFLACDGRTWYPVKKYGRHENGVPFTTDFAEDDTLLSAEQNEFPAGTKVVLTTTGTLPDPLATSTTYFVRDRTRDTLTLAATETGDAIPLTDDGTGTHMLYKVAESSYYPAVFERELFRVEVTEEMLHVGSLFETHIALELATYAANTNAFWTLAFEVGEKLVDDAPGTPGHNLARIRWRGTPILEQPIVLTPNAAVHRFGLEIGRALVDSVDTLSATGHIYGATDESLVPPNAAGFLLRARLIRFDTENNQPDPDGFVLMRGLTSDSPDAPQIEGGARIR